MTRSLFALGILWTLVLLTNAPWAHAALQVTNLRCESRVDPFGVDSLPPRLSWVLTSPERAQAQSAYQILAASAPELLAQDKGDFWDSGKVTSDETLQIKYAGKALASSQSVFWKARVWDAVGNASAWSPPATFSTGVLNDSDWAARWIGAPASPNVVPSATLLFRKSLVIRPVVKRAILHICGLGQYEASINGKRVGQNLLTPGWTLYNSTCLYDSYDVTSLVTDGNNAIGVLLGNGMYNVTGGRYAKFKGSFGPLKMIAQLHLEFVDGEIVSVGTDGTWVVTPGPITFSCVYGGEDYDARLEPANWNMPDYDDAQWLTAAVLDGPGGKLKGLSCAAPPIRAFDVVKPTAIHELKPGVRVYDLGQNASFMPRFTVQGTAGSMVRLTPAELLKPDGSVDRASSGGGEAYWQYTLAGAPSETWFPKFFYHGCRYLQVECMPAGGGNGELPVVKSLEGVVVHSSSDPVGEFSCSNDLFDRTRTLIRWAQRSNLMSVLTDCPHRERLGWLEQDYLNGPSLRYEFDLGPLMNKAMNDMADSQTKDGLIPDIAPEYTVFQDGFRDSPEWGSAFVQCAWQQYIWDGDVQVFARYYDAMKQYITYLTGKSRDGVVDYGLGDWFDVGPRKPGQAQLTPKSLTATALYYDDVRIMARVATLLGKEKDAADFATLADKIKEGFNRALFHADTNTYATGSQTSNAMALALDLAPAGARPKILDALVRDIHGRGNGLTSGDVGYHYLLRALAEGGRSDVIFDMNNQSDKPGYGYQLAHGATSLTEAWDTHSGSQNHFMLGHIMEWFYHDLAGIGPDPDAPGFKHILIHPTPVGDVTWAKTSYESVRGKITASWKKESGQFTLETTIPANTTATVWVPAKDPPSVTEGGKPASSSNDIKFIRMDNGAAVFEVGSGAYVFTTGAEK